jgi:hypothetical protein
MKRYVTAGNVLGDTFYIVIETINLYTFSIYFSTCYCLTQLPSEVSFSLRNLWLTKTRRQKQKNYIFIYIVCTYLVCPKRSCSGLAKEWDVNWWHTPPALFTQQDPVDVL